MSRLHLLGMVCGPSTNFRAATGGILPRFRDSGRLPAATRTRDNFPIVPSRTFSSMSKSIRGQSGRVYTIENPLQDKGSQLGQVHLARYILPDLTVWCGELTVLNQQRHESFYTEGCIAGLGDTDKHIHSHWQLSLHTWPVGYGTGAQNVRVRVSQREPTTPCPERSAQSCREADPQICTQRARYTARPGYCS